MYGRYDWHYDRNHDGELDFFEKYEMDDEMDRFAKRGYYAEESLGIDDPDDFDDDDDFGSDGLDRDDFDEDDFDEDDFDEADY